MKTLRQLLDDAGANWSKLVVVVQADEEGRSSPALCFKARSAFELDLDLADSLLDQAFNEKAYSPEAPCFIADDGDFLYFPAEYDRHTSLVKVAKNISYYLNPENQTPYPGGE